MKIIDQTKQEKKDASKKLQNIHTYHDGKIKSLENELLNTKNNFHEKNAHLKIVLENSNQLKQENKIMEMKNIQLKSTILKLKEKKKPKKYFFLN